MARLTTFSKFLITLLIVGGVYFAFRYFVQNTEAGQKIKQQGSEQSSKPGGGLFGGGSSLSSDKNAIKVGVVTWGGYAGGQYWNDGFVPNANSRFKRDYGFNVDFKVLDDFEASRNAFKSDDVNLLWATIDAFPTEAGALADYDPVVVFQYDWSRGGDANVVRRGISKVEDLRGKKIAVAELTPSHSFLLWFLEAGGLKMSDVEIVKQASAIDAAAAFKSQAVDAAVVWSPDDALCVQAVAGARVLQSTRSATNIIADVFIAKRKWAEANREKLQQLYEGWMKGAAEINTVPSAKTRAAEILASQFNISTADARQSIDNVRLTTHGDNQNFFGLNTAYQGIAGEALYSRMTNVYRGLGYIDGKVPNFRIVAWPEAVKMTSLTGPQNAAEAQKGFSAPTAAEKTKEAVATKRVSITFPSGQFRLDENAKYIVDKEMVELAKAFAGSRIRVEGNTDNVGNDTANRALSQKRAQAVVDYLVSQHGMPRNRFIVVGNGADNPVETNDTEAGRSKNRRTDFELVEN